jgi:hypothetical protein
LKRSSDFFFLEAFQRFGKEVGRWCRGREAQQDLVLCARRMGYCDDGGQHQPADTKD